MLNAHVQEHPDLVNALGWRDSAMAHVKHPENEHEAIPGHHLAEEWDLGYPGRSPVVLHRWNRNDPHVDHHGQESLELCDGDGIPLEKATVLLQFALSPQLFNPRRCIAVKGQAYFLFANY